MHMLSQLDQDEAFAIIERNALRYSEFHCICADELKQSYLQSRASGYGINRDGQISGVTAVGVALPAGAIAGAQFGIGVACISPRMTDSHVSFVVKEVKATIEAFIKGTVRSI